MSVALSYQATNLCAQIHLHASSAVLASTELCPQSSLVRESPETLL